MPQLTNQQASALLKAIGSYTVRDLVDAPDLRAAVMALFGTLPAFNYEPWHRSAVAYCVSNEAVNSIKTIRAATGFGLKDAKDIHDNLRDHLARQGRTSPLSYVPSPLRGEQLDVLNVLIAAAQ
jgi:hypothetical protein